MSKKFLVDILAKAGLIVEGTTNLQGPANAITVASNDNSTKIATTAFVKSQGFLNAITQSQINNALGYTPVPTSRQLTINGTAYDLSADRSWTITPNINATLTQDYTATAGQTVFTVSAGYTVGQLAVFYNGAKLASSEFTATDGTTFTLASASLVNDIVQAVAWVTGGGISLGSLSATSPLLFNNVTGIFSIQVANISQNGYLSSADWNTFKGKQNALSGTGFIKISGTTISYDNSAYYLASNPNGYTNNTGTVTSIDTTGPITGGIITGSGTIGITQATTTANGYLSSTDWNVFNNKLSTLTATNTYIPYTGATKAANLGAYDLTVNTLTIGLGKSSVTSNTAIGRIALYTNTTGRDNLAVGYVSLYANTTGDQNTSIGSSALFVNTTGSNNTAVGFLSLYANTTGAGNTALGKSSLQGSISGNNNIGIGLSAGSSITTGSNNTIVGSYSGTTTLASNVVLADGAGNIRFQWDGTNIKLNGSIVGSNAYTSTAYTPTARTITINGTAFDLSADRAWTVAGGLSSFNTRTGAITLSSGDVTTALGFTPYNATNPSGYITSSALSAYLPLAGGANMTASYGLNDSKLYLRGNNDNNHYIWNANDDWEEIVAYFGTGLRITASNGTVLATFATGGNSMNITGSAGSVAWTNVSGRPTTVSSFTNDSGYITSSASISGSSGSVSGLTLTSSANGINPDSVTQNQIGYNSSVSLFGQSDGGLYSSAYGSAWIHQIYGDFRTGQIAIRGKNAGTWQAWRTVIDSGNIGSQSVSYASTAGNVNSISSAVGGAYSWTGTNYFVSNRNTSTDSAPLQAYSNNGGGAIMSFHRGGYYAINMGLDSDNVFRIGGWSAGVNRLQLDMSGNLTVAGSFNGSGSGLSGTASSLSVNYANSAGSASNITAYTINQSVGTGNGVSFASIYSSGALECAGDFQFDSAERQVGRYRYLYYGYWAQWFDMNGGNGGGSLIYADTLYATYGSISDIRYKKEVTKSVYGLSDILKLNTIKFKYDLPVEKRSGNDINFHIGFSAQELLEIIPEAVMYDNNREVYAVASNELIPVLVNSTQEIVVKYDSKIALLQAQIDAQQTTINQLLAVKI